MNKGEVAAVGAKIQFGRQGVRRSAYFSRRPRKDGEISRSRANVRGHRTRLEKPSESSAVVHRAYT